MKTLQSKTLLGIILGLTIMASWSPKVTASSAQEDISHGISLTRQALSDVQSFSFQAAASDIQSAKATISYYLGDHQVQQASNSLDSAMERISNYSLNDSEKSLRAVHFLNSAVNYLQSSLMYSGRTGTPAVLYPETAATRELHLAIQHIEQARSFAEAQDFRRSETDIHNAQSNLFRSNNLRDIDLNAALQSLNRSVSLIYDGLIADYERADLVVSRLNDAINYIQRSRVLGLRRDVRVESQKDPETYPQTEPKSYPQTTEPKQSEPKPYPQQ